MRLTTILNFVEKHKGFVYQTPRWGRRDGQRIIEVPIKPRANSRPICAKCEFPGPCYDRRGPRRFEYVPLWNIPVVLIYVMRRVNCPVCGVTIETVPWGDGKHPTTTTFRWFLAGWAKRLSWSEVAQAFGVSWQCVFRSVQHAVSWGLERRDLDGVRAIGVDEVAWKKGHEYLTLVYQIDAARKRLLWVSERRTTRSLLRFFRAFGKERCAALEFVCSDMWKPYLKVIAKKASQAIHVLDRFHIMQKLNKAIDEVRAAEAKRLKANGYEPVLTRSRWCLLKRPTKLTNWQAEKLSELLKYNLRTVRAYLAKEDFQRFWSYVSPHWAGRFLDQWCTRAMRSKLEPLKKVAKTLRAHRELILNWFRAKGAYSSGVVEGLNGKVKLTTKRAYGFRVYEAVETALYHTLGDLPEPEFTHRFW